MSAKHKFWKFICFAIAGLQAIHGKVTIETKEASPAGPIITFSGKVLVETLMGPNHHTSTYLFPGAGLSGLFQNSTTEFNTYDAGQMFLLNGSRFSVTASNPLGDDTIASLVGTVSLNQGASRMIKEAYGMIDSSGWNFKLGNTYGVEETMAVGPLDIVQGSGGIYGGSFSKFLPNTSGVWIYPGLIGDTGTATKGVIATPRMGGFMFSASYTPNTDHFGELAMNTGVSSRKDPFSIFDLNSVALAVNYLSAWEGGSLGVSFGRITANTHQEKPLLPQKGEDRVVVDGKVVTQGLPTLSGNELERNNTQGWQVGGALTIGQTSIAAEYLYGGNSHTLKNDFNPVIYFAPGLNGQKEVYSQGITPPSNIGNLGTFAPKMYQASQAGDARLWTIGICQKMDQWGVSVTYMQSSTKTGFLSATQTVSNSTKAQGFTIACQYNVSPGVAPYVEFGRFKLTNPDWPYMATMIPSLTKFEYTGVPSYSDFYTAFLVGIKLQF